MAQQTRVSLTEAARNGTLRDCLTQYIEYCLCPDGTDSRTTPGSNRRTRRLFPNLAGFCYWMGCGMSAFDELQSTFPDEADMILCAMEDQALNAYYLKVTILMAYLRNRLGYDPPKRGSATRGNNNRAKDCDRPCKIEVYSASQYEALFGTADPPAAQDSEPSTEHIPELLTEPTPDPPPDSPPEQATRTSLRKRIAAPPPYSIYRIRHTAKRSTSPPTRSPPPTKINQPPEQLYTAQAVDDCSLKTESIEKRVHRNIN